MFVPKKPLALAVFGLAALLGGVVFKLNHLQGAEALFNAGSTCLVLGLVWVAVSLFFGESGKV